MGDGDAETELVKKKPPSTKEPIQTDIKKERN